MNKIIASSLGCVLALNLAPRSMQAQAATSPAPSVSPPKSSARAKYEPARGVYLGAALDVSALPGGATMTNKMAGAMRDWNAKSGKKHAIQLQFIPFPHEDGAFPAWDKDPKGWATSKDFADASAAVGAAPMLTLEPFANPQDFARNWKPGSKAYDATANYARAVGAWGKPLFIRFAHEMNGSWYPWAEWIDKNANLQRDAGEETGFNASDYRAAYRDVALLLRRLAPNAALVWCPNSGLLGGARRDVFTPWYPGDDVVDWVGLDIYERGWTMPLPGAKLWGGQFAHNLTHDALDDGATATKNESVDFYHTFAEKKNKPMMICETAATLSYRGDMGENDRFLLDSDWKTGYWNEAEYGWMQAVYGTTGYRTQALKYPLDRDFPRIKAIVWFQVAKRETIPVEKPFGVPIPKASADVAVITNSLKPGASFPVVRLADKRQIVWFNNAQADYRINDHEQIDLYRALTKTPHFLSELQK